MDRWIEKLGDDLEGPIHSVSPDWLIEHCIDAVGTDPVKWAIGGSHEIIRRLTHAYPEFTAPDGGHRITRLGAESCMLHVLLILSGTRQPDWFPEEQIQVVRDRARRNIPLSRLLGAIRIAHAVTSELYLNAASQLAAPEDQAGALKRVSSAVMSLFDVLNAQGVEEYRTESGRWEQGSNDKLREIIDELLTSPAQGLAPIETRLNYPIRGRMHLGAVAWSEAGTSNKTERFLREWLENAGARSIITFEPQPSIVWGWGATETADITTRPFPATHTPSEARIAYGNWGRGLEGFRLSHRQAMAAEYVTAVAPSFNATEISYSEVGLISLLLSHPERATDFMFSVLGPLIGNDTRKKELRDTIQAFLQLRSPKAVAERLFVARGTVTYRLRQAEEILGFQLEARAQDLTAALILADILPHTRLDNA